MGQAELWCALLSVSALLLYMRAAGGGVCARRHWATFAGAVGLAWMAALSKEIGITVVGTMALYDLVIPDEAQITQAPGGGAGGAKAPGAASGARELRAQLRRRLERRRLARLAVLAAAGLAYVKLRSWVAVDQLVRIYRKVRGRPTLAGSGDRGRRLSCY